MTETTKEESAEAQDLMQDHGPETTEEGRYIPYSGGRMGWFENSGVLKCELGNNYLFYTLMESDLVRSKQFERWGERFNRRGRRDRVRKEKEVTIVYGGREVRGSTRDISSHGVRIQFLEEVELNKGDACSLRIHEGASSDVLVEAEGKVVWAEKIGRIRPVWNLGLTFLNLSPEQSEKLSPLLEE